MDTVTFFIWSVRLFGHRIYWLFLAVVVMCLSHEQAFSQELGAYKTISSGTFSNISIWAEWDGLSWNPALTKPNGLRDIYIDQNHLLTLTGDEAVKSIFINAQTDAAQKLNLSGFQLEVHGSLNAFSGSAPGIPANAWNSQNWIGNSISSTIIFRGSSRVLIHTDSWSGQTLNSRFSVIFDADPGETFFLEAPFKALSFIVRSGTLHQRLNTSVVPNFCSTLSFNTETTVFGTGPFGTFTVESGATFISECNANIINRSVTLSALDFNLMQGGAMILEGNAPRIEAANIQLNGRVIYRGGSTIKSFLTSTYPDAGIPASARDIELQSPHDLNLPAQLTLWGNLEKTSTGNFISTNTNLTLLGSDDQEILGFPLSVRDLTVNKDGGVFYPHASLVIQRNLVLIQGNLDMEGHDLFINTELSGSLSYTEGSWRNVGQLNYHGLPATLSGSNSTFPFEDTQNGGLRKMQLLGNTSGGNLSILFSEAAGAQYHAGFFDYDGIEILYHLFSHFQFSGFTPSADLLEMRISAHQLIVDDVDDLRIVGTGYAAPGSHLHGLDPTELWARREMTFAELGGTNFTVGSFRTLSILPITWLGIHAQHAEKGIWIHWEVMGEEEDSLFRVFRSSSPQESEWVEVDAIDSRSQQNLVNEYRLLDISANPYGDNYYRIKLELSNGETAWSTVAKAPRKPRPFGHLAVYPNPYHAGTLRLALPNDLDPREAEVTIHDVQGKLIHRFKYESVGIDRFVLNLPPGLYYVTLESSTYSVGAKLLRN